MARILIIGASSGIGLETVKGALAAGHTVRAFARQASGIALSDANLETVDGDALDAGSVESAVVGVDGVVQSLGVKLTPETILSGTRLFSSATRILVDVLTRTGPRRLIMVSGLGAGDSRDALGPLYRAAFELSLRRIYDDKDVAEMMVRRSGLDWTILRPGFLTDRPTGECRVLTERQTYRPGSIARADVAGFIVRHWDDPAYFGTTPVLIAG